MCSENEEHIRVCQYTLISDVQTLVVKLYPQLLRYASRASDHDVVFGGVRTNKFLTNSSIQMSTASDGAMGAQGNNPRFIS